MLFINVFPSTIIDDSFPTYFEKLIQDPSIPKNRIVLEILEKETNIKRLKKNTSLIKEMGIKIALDDVGGGYLCLQKILELNPDYIKLDQYFSVELSTSTKKQELLVLLSKFCKGDSILILEGIEKEADLAVAKLLGIQLGQGYLLGKPHPLWD